MALPPPPPPLPPEVQQALQAGQTIQAIRRLRESTGLGLREAKARIDAAQAFEAGRRPSVGRPTPRHGPVEEPRWRSRPGWIVGLALVLALLGWWFSHRA